MEPVIFFVGLVLIAYLTYIHISLADKHWSTQKQLKVVEARLIVMSKQMKEAAFNDLIAYIKEHEGKDAIKEFPGPTRPKTRKWLINHGILTHDRQALIFKYLEKALNPPTNEKN
ncbi:hypothetical protein M0L20_13535 [Spirosoma sp. RP8]|uniref:Uncharacterized protein n=1 Tax=Spirosoma liriopis TaxID=2937440 RepID=A0ABT0HL45_9BACT|nr:hypothetical protein [Spirosoma liriopis]MCK8492884.1 hypothetical protein [Spirosoma liriopis]